MTLENTPINGHDELLLLAYVEDELSGTDRAAFERELAGDPELRALIDALRADRQRLRSLAPTAAPSDMVERVIQRLERQTLLGPVTAGDDLSDDSATTPATSGDRSPDEIEAEPGVASTSIEPIARIGFGRVARVAGLAAALALSAWLGSKFFGPEKTITQPAPGGGPMAAGDQPGTEGIRDLRNDNRLAIADGVDRGKDNAGGGTASTVAGKSASSANERPAIDPHSDGRVAVGNAKTSDSHGNFRAGQKAADGHADLAAAAAKGAGGLNDIGDSANLKAVVSPKGAHSQQAFTRRSDADGTGPNAPGGVQLADQAKSIGQFATAQSGRQELFEYSERVEVGQDRQYARLTATAEVQSELAFDESPPVDRVATSGRSPLPQPSAAPTAPPTSPDPTAPARPVPTEAPLPPAPDAAQHDDRNATTGQLADAPTRDASISKESADSFVAAEGDTTTRIEVVSDDPDASRREVMAWAQSRKLSVLYTPAQTWAGSQRGQAETEGVGQSQAKDVDPSRRRAVPGVEQRKADTQDEVKSRPLDPSVTRKHTTPSPTTTAPNRSSPRFNQQQDDERQQVASADAKYEASQASQRQVVYLSVPRDQLSGLLSHLNDKGQQKAQLVKEHNSASEARPSIESVTRAMEKQRNAPTKNLDAKLGAANAADTGARTPSPATTPSANRGNQTTVQAARTAPSRAESKKSEQGLPADASANDDALRRGTVAQADKAPGVELDGAQLGQRFQQRVVALDAINWGLILRDQLSIVPSMELAESEAPVTVSVIIEKARQAPANPAPDANQVERANQR